METLGAAWLVPVKVSRLGRSGLRRSACRWGSPSAVGGLLRDPLTGWPERSRLIRDIRVNACPVLWLVNIDGFREVNSHFGLETGDALLRAAGRRLAELSAHLPVRRYKLPGDSFALLGNLRTAPRACRDLAPEHIPWRPMEGLARRLTARMEQEPLLLEVPGAAEPLPLVVGVTVGMAVARTVGRENLLTHAEMALRTAKNEHRAYLFYRPPVNPREACRDHLHWAAMLRRALADDRIVPYFQPIYSHRQGRVVMHEALMRLVGPDGRVHPPDRFLRVARLLRIYPKLTVVMLAKCLKIVRATRQDIAVNLGLPDILNPDLMRFLTDTIGDLDLGRHITVEILESEGIDHYRTVARALARLADLGCRIAVDDFGVGYSNFAHLVQLKVDQIKIDASLIGALDTQPEARIVVQAIVRFARELGIQTVAEGVSRSAVLEAVTFLGVDCSQGHQIGPPRPELPGWAPDGPPNGGRAEVP